MDIWRLCYARCSQKNALSLRKLPPISAFCSKIKRWYYLTKTLTVVFWRTFNRFTTSDFHRKHRHYQYTGTNHQNSLHIPSIRRKLHSDCFFIITARLRIRLSSLWFHDCYNFNHINSKINNYLSYLFL